MGCNGTRLDKQSGDRVFVTKVWRDLSVVCESSLKTYKTLTYEIHSQTGFIETVGEVAH